MATLAEYAFDEGTGTTAADTSGNGNTLTGVPGWSASGHTNAAIDVSGGNGPTTTILTGVSTFTIMGWFRADAITGWRSMLEDATAGFYFEANGGAIDCYNNAVSLVSSISMSVGTWIHLAYAQDATNSELIVNGVSQDTATPHGLGSGIPNITLGGSAQQFDGQIDDLRIVDQKLTATEVAALMDTPVGGGGGPVEGQAAASFGGTFTAAGVGGGPEVAFGAIGTLSAGGTTTISVAYPAGIAAGDLVVAGRTIWTSSAGTASDESGWTPAGDLHGGTGTSADAHTTRIRADYLVATGSESGSVTFDQGGTLSGAVGQMVRYSKTGGTWDVASATGTDNTHGANRSITTSSSLALAPGDWLVAVVAQDTDASQTITAPTFSATGITFGTATRRTSGAGVGTGNDGNIDIFDVPVTAGTGTQAVTFSLTSATSQCGPVVILRLRLVESTTIQGSAAAAFGGTFTAAGVPTTHGQATATFGFSASAVVLTFPYVTAASTSGRHLVDQTGAPIISYFDTLWNMPVIAGRDNAGDWQGDMDLWIDTRSGQGFNGLKFCLFAQEINGGPADLLTHDNLSPFDTTSPSTADITAFNEDYWERVDYLIDQAAAAGMTCWVHIMYKDDVAHSSGTGWLEGHTNTDYTNFGTALANRYKDRPNIVWVYGGDYFDESATQMELVADAMRTAGDTHLVTVMNYSDSSGGTFWTSSRQENPGATELTLGNAIAEIDSLYTYENLHDGAELAWADTPTLPVIYYDGYYDSTDSAGATNIRRDWGWALTSGAWSSHYGSEATWAMNTGWRSSLDATLGVQHTVSMMASFTALTGWEGLVPDWGTAFITSARGSGNSYIMGAVRADGALGVVYMPNATGASVTIDDTALTASYDATWVDPTNGATVTATPTSGTTYQKTGANAASGTDWLLVFTEAAGATVEGQATATFGGTFTAAGVTTTPGQAAGAFGGTFVAAGVDRALGVAAASFGGTFTASGSVGTPPVQGQATSAFGGTFTAAGVDRALGTAAGAFGFAASASGQAGGTGAASAALGFTATANGLSRALGAAAASYGFTSTAAGLVGHDGTAVVAFGFAATATGFAGTPPVSGQASTSFGGTFGVAGVRRPVGSSSATFGGTFTAAGVATTIITGQATGSFGGTFTATGVDRALGAGEATFGFAAVIVIFRAPPPAERTATVATAARRTAVPADTTRVHTIPARTDQEDA